MKLSLDPWFGLFSIPKNEDEYSRFLRTNYFTTPDLDGTQGMTSSGKRWGAIPQIHRYHKDWKGDTPFHRHLFLELVLVVDGIGRFQEGKNYFDLGAGDLLFINHFCHHRISSARAGFTYFDLRFDASFLDRMLKYLDSPEQLSAFRYLRSFFKVGRGKTLQLHLEDRETKKTLMRCLQILDTFLRKPFRETLFHGDLRFLLESLTTQGDFNRLDFPMGQIREHLSQSFSEKITTSDLAKRIGISRGSLSKEWNDKIGISLPRYIALVRLERAKELLRSTDFSTQHIALECGFSSDSYFVKTFKKENEISPGEYRKRTKSGK
ncbi:MAG: helix-turn-helix transcriptional regulator [Alphaproteobacteria bacterium]|nr:helix-turn-helix transcriptional regulator [Alphaproteobacteria bacterium]